MQFPVDITFKMLGWRAKVHVTDGAGRMLGYIPFSKRKDGALSIFADERMGTPIYMVRAEHAFTHWFEDAAGRRIGEWGITPSGGMGGGKHVFVGGEPRFSLTSASGWLDFMDSLIPSLPLLNGLTGLWIRPRLHAVRRQDGANVLCIVKRRMAIDIRYTIYELVPLSGRENECLLLATIVYVLLDRHLRSIA